MIALFSGITVDVVDEMGASVASGERGFLAIRDTWPDMLRGIWSDMDRCKGTCWSHFENTYFAGEDAKKDDEGTTGSWAGSITS